MPAQAATTEHPSGGSRFVGDQEGWAGSGAVCDGTNGSICSTSTVWEPSAGNPPGSITMRMDATLNLLGTFQGVGVWTSPTFVVPAGQAVSGATFAHDRQLAAGGLLGLAPQSHVVVELVDEAGGPAAKLLEEDLTTADSSFATRGAGASAGAVVAGHTYRLRITTTTTTAVVSFGLTGQDNTRFDNVVLAVDQSSPGGGAGPGGTTPVVSEGVTVVKTFRSTARSLPCSSASTRARRSGTARVARSCRATCARSWARAARIGSSARMATTSSAAWAATT